MNAERLLQLFEHVAEAPDAVAKLRQLILDLAVRGQLVEQKPSEGRALDLLAEVVQLKAQSVTRERYKRIDNLEISKLENLPFEIPASWSWVNLGNISNVLMGQSPSGASYNQSGDGLPLINGPTEFTPLPFGLTVINQFTNQPTQICEQGDFLICVRGSTTGRTNIAGQRACIGRGIAAIQPLFADQFVRWWIVHQRNVIFDTGSGSTFPNINKNQLTLFPVPLPPLAEQHRIVQRVDELMALCDQLEAAQTEREQRRDRLNAAALKQLVEAKLGTYSLGDPAHHSACFYLNHLPRLTTKVEHIKALRQTILDLAVRGQLVAQDPADEHANNLVARIYEARKSEVAKGRLKKQELLPELDDKTPFTLPKTWKWLPLQNLLNGDSQNGFSKKPDDNPDGIPILRISAGTVRSDYIIAEEEHKLISRTNSGIEANFSLDEGDLLVCRFNGNRDYVGRFSLFKNYLEINPIYPDKLIRIRVFRRLTVPDLLRYFANSNPIRQEIEQYCATTVGNWGISATNLKKIPIPLPPLAEQHRIVAKVDQLMALCDHLEAAIETQRHATSRLLDALIAEALAIAPSRRQSKRVYNWHWAFESGAL